MRKPENAKIIRIIRIAISKGFIKEGDARSCADYIQHVPGICLC
jgi:predicted SnoaL-like aldol condensation-catalyzing enzyme